MSLIQEVICMAIVLGNISPEMCSFTVFDKCVFKTI